MRGRRAFLIAMGLMAAAPPPAVARSHRVWRIGVVRPGVPDAVFRSNFGPFVRALNAHGFAEGTNLVIDYRVRPGTVAELEHTVREMLAEPPDAIVAIAPGGVRAASRATRSVPIVAIDLESDPIAEKFVTTLARPGGNVTGLFLDFPTLGGKWIELLREAVPRLSHVAVLWDPETGDSLVRGAQTAARQFGMQLTVLEARDPADFQAAFDRAAERRANGMLVLSSPVLNSARAVIADHAARRRLPAIMPFTGFVQAGGLLAYGPDLPAMFEQAAELMVRILKGQQPAELPIARPARFALGVNLRTAKTLGLSMPPSILLRADQVVQ